MYLEQLIEFKRGDTIALNFKFTDCENKSIDLTNCTARLQIRFVNIGELTVAATDEDMLTIIPQFGEVVLSIPANLSKNFTVGRHSFDLEVTFYDGTVISSETKYINIIKDITV